MRCPAYLHPTTGAQDAHCEGDEMDRDATTIKLERRVRKLTRVNRLLVSQRDRAMRDANRAAVLVEDVREFIDHPGLCPHCRRALRAAAMVEAA